MSDFVYPKTALNKVKQSPARAAYDVRSIVAILDALIVLDVAFIMPGVDDEPPRPGA